MHFTREPIIETVLTPRSGFKLVIRNSKSVSPEEYFVESIEVVSFGNALFFRSVERPKAFLVPISDYEVFEVRETRLVLKALQTQQSQENVASGENKDTKRRESKRRRRSKQKAEKTNKNTELSQDDVQESPVQESPVEEQVEAQDELEISTTSSGENMSDLGKEESQEPKSQNLETGRTKRNKRRSSSGKNKVDLSKKNEDNKKVNSEDFIPPIPKLIPPPPGLVSDLLSYERIHNEAVERVSHGDSSLAVSMQIQESEPSEKKAEPEATKVEGKLFDFEHEYPVMPLE